MTFPADELYLGPATFGRRRGTEGFTWNTTEAADASRASAIGTADYQKRNPGSYNFIIFDGGILLTVPYLEASGGVNPFSTAWAPQRYPELKQKLSAAAYADPNAYLMNVAFSGKTAVFRDRGMPQNMVDTARRLVAWAETTFGRPMVHTSHAMWQTNRTDPGTRVMQLINPVTLPDTSAEDDVDLSTLTPIVNRKAAVSQGAAARSKPEFNPKDYDANLISTEPANRYRTAIGWVTGTNLTLSDGTVYDPRTRWLMTDSDQHGPIFYHERDVTGFVAIETVEVSTGIDPAAYTALQLQGAGLFDEAARFATNAAQILRAKKP